MPTSALTLHKRSVLGHIFNPIPSQALGYAEWVRGEQIHPRTLAVKADIHAEYVSRIFYRIWISYVVKCSTTNSWLNILLHRIFIFYRIFLNHILHVQGVPDKSVLLWSQIAQSPCIGCVWNFERRIRRHIRSTFVSMTFLSHDPVYYFFDDIWDFQILQKRIFGKKFANFISCRT